MAFSKRTGKYAHLQRSRIAIGAAVGYFGIHTVAVHPRGQSLSRPQTPLDRSGLCLCRGIGLPLADIDLALKGLVIPSGAHPDGRVEAGRTGPLMGMNGSAGEGGVDDSHSFPEQFLRRRSVSQDPTFHSDSHVNSDSARGPAGTLGSDATTPLAYATGGPAGGPATLTTYGGGNTALTARPLSSPSRVEFAVGQLATAAITQPHTFFRMPLPLHLCNCVSVCLCVSE